MVKEKSSTQQCFREGIMLVPRRVDWIEGTTISILFSHKILRAVPDRRNNWQLRHPKKPWVSPANSLKPPLADKCSTVLPILSGVLGEPEMHQTPCPLAVKWVGSQVIPEYKVFGKLPKQKQNRGTSTIDDLYDLYVNCKKSCITDLRSRRGGGSVLLIFLKLSDSNFQFKGAIKERSSSNSKNESLDNILKIPSRTSSQDISVCCFCVFVHTFCELPKKMDINSPGLVGPSRLISRNPSRPSPTFPTQLPNKVRISVQDQSTDLSLSSLTAGDEKLGVRRLPIAVGRSKQREHPFCWLLRENESPRDPSFILKTKKMEGRIYGQNTNGTTLIDTKPR